MIGRYRAGLVAGMIALLIFSLGPSSASSTDYEIDPSFQWFYDRSGGLPVFGYPISNPVREDGRLVQYFERQRFELHPEHTGTPYEVLLGHVGRQDADRRGLVDHPAFDPLNPSGAVARGEVFPETGHSLSGVFREYWRAHGLELGDPGISYRESMALFGLPISEEFTDPETRLRTQYFERARFEYHPEHEGTEFAILLGHLGKAEWQQMSGELAESSTDSGQLDPDAAPGTASNLEVGVDPTALPETKIQQMVDRAAPGATVRVPAGVYRETVVIDKPLTLVAEPGAEIRGSDVWSSGWTRPGNYWVRGSVPEFANNHGHCQSGDSCKWQEQVYLDGRQLHHVESNPASGEFAVNSRREIVLADDPSDRLVEVSTRQYWLVGASANVTVEGFTMKQAANRAQTGAINNGGYGNWTIRNNTMSHAHGANVSLHTADNLNLIGNEISHAGGLGVHGGGDWFSEPRVSATNVTITGNRIHSNNTAGYSAGWEAGGLKLVYTDNVLIRDNVVYDNDGPGLWCDIDCTDTTFSGNRVHHNRNAGIRYELSQGGEISNNIVFENGYGYTVWGWGSGIIVQNSSDTEVRDNLVAWNADGIAVISQDRGLRRWNDLANILVRDNVVLGSVVDGVDDFLLAWLEDFDGPLGNGATISHGESNRYWREGSGGVGGPFRWVNGAYAWDDLNAFSETSGESAGRYLALDEAQEILSSAGVPARPESLR